MGRTVIADEKLVQDLSNLSKCGGFIPGLIIGQCAVPGQKDYVIHLAPTPSPEVGEDEVIGDGNPARKSYNKLSDIVDNTISEHARVVTRMLPGGMWVLGFYVVGPGDLFSDKSSLPKLKSIANNIHSCTKGNDYMNGKDPSNQKLILQFCSDSKKYVCKTIEMDNLNSSVRPVDWKFKSYTTSWSQVDSVLDFEWLPPFFIKNIVGTRKKLLECLAKFKEHLDSLKFNINTNFCEADQLLNSIEQPAKENGCDDDEEENHCKYNLMFFELLQPPKNGNVEDALVIEEDSELKFHGLLASRVYLNEKSTVEDALKAVKDDFIRSLASRLEMHWQTVDESEAIDHDLKYFLRSPPRRVLFKPSGLDIEFSEFVFEGETENEALSSIAENLGFMDCEIFVLENDLDPVKDSDMEEETSSGGSTEGVSHSPVKADGQQSSSFLMYGLTAACVTLLISLLIHFLYS